MAKVVYVRNGRSMSKRARDKILTIFVGIISVLIFIIAAPALGHAIAPANATVLSPESSPSYIYGSNGTSVPFAVTNSTAQFSPQTHTTYLVYPATMAEMNSRSVGKITVSTGYTGSVNATLGFGTNPSNFVPESYVTVHNGSKIAIPVTYSMLDGNQSSHMMIELGSNATSYAIVTTVTGNSGLTTFLGTASIAEIMYFVGGIVILMVAFVGSTVHDLNVSVKAIGRKK